MANNIAPLRGMKDLYFEEYEIFKHIENTSYNLSKIYGFQGLQTPILESINVFDRTLGETSDVVSKEIYHFQDKKGRDVAMRPEFTASVMRAVLSNGLQQHLPIKFFSSGPLFRYDRPQEGRQRQFHQLNFESIGKRGAHIDAEIITLAQHLLEDLGVAQDLTLEINSLGCFESRKNYQNALIEYFSQYTDRLSEDSKKRLEKNPLRILDSKDKADIIISENAPVITDFYTDEARQYFTDVKSTLDSLGIKYEENARLVRGLDYYSDTIFEYTTTKLGAQSTVLAGGRYDGLAKLMGGGDIPAIGFAAGYERIMLMKNFITQKNRPVCILPFGQEELPASIKLVNKLRQTKIATILSIDGKVTKRLQSAVNSNAKYVIFIGKDEIESGLYTLKNLDTKQEKKESIDQLLQIIKE
ncbi:MAG: hypothetical protein DGJ47_000791 [Rickettsiaceae bacterium]